MKPGFLIVALLLSLSSCRSGPEKNPQNLKPDAKRMEELNRYMVEKDRERIQNYIARKNLSMKETPSGLWYQVLSEGEGSNYTFNSRVIYEYECSLLDGDLCYSSARTGPKEIILGKSGIETGLDQGLRLLKPGGSAIFILPPFLAYGFRGDGKKIPSRATLVYTINTLKSVDKK